MSFCIECGAKAPEVAKFCPQCGVPLVAIDAVSDAATVPVTSDVETPDLQTAGGETPQLENSEALPTEAGPIEPAKEDVTVEIAVTNAADADPAHTPPSAAASLSTAANASADAPKSKGGLFVGLGLIALIAAGGGAYATGLFDSAKTDIESNAKTVAATIPSSAVQTEAADTEASVKPPILTAYQEAIKSGRISDLGKFAKNNPKHSLAKDAETAAFASLERQGSGLAFKTFVEYFPDADLSSYTGLRVDINDASGASPSTGGEMDASVAPSQKIRASITERAGELDAFIAQGDTGYAVAVIDEMLALTDLNEDEATYLLNLRASTETSGGFTASTSSEFIEIEPVQSQSVEPLPEINADAFTCWDGSVVYDVTACPPGAIVEAPSLTAPAAAIEPESDPAAADEIAPGPESKADPDRLFDTPAKPIERFGAITPDAATEPGECDMAFSIDVSGTPVNIIASCSDPMFVAPAKETVSDWTYSPALLDGAPVQQNGVVVKIRFNLE